MSDASVETTMSWAVPNDTLNCVELRAALLTPFRHGKAGGRRTAHTGAVYSNGQLVLESCRAGGLGSDLCIHTDANSLDEGASANAPLRRGRWLYGGHFMKHFGHFITETLTNLWPASASRVDGVVFLPFIWGGDMAPWQVEQIRVLFPEAEIMVADRAYRFERLTVPERPFLPNRGVATPALSVWDRLAKAASQAVSRSVGDRIFLSRSQLAVDPRRVEGDERLDQLFREHGFEIVFPEQLEFAQQLRAVSGANVVAGLTGSALHLAAFADHPLHVLEIGDRRSHSKGILTQRAINVARSHKAAFLPFREDLEGRDIDFTRDMVTALLSRL